ncbi:MAG: hypothetical protein UU88_C0001G0125, partial [Parcubacteria group bacterium GW2011_GWC1_42_11]
YSLEEKEKGSGTFIYELRVVN